MTTDLLALELDVDLSHREYLAVKHLLTCSALAYCVGVPDRVLLVDDRRLIMHDLADWGWSSGEVILLRVLASLVGRGALPALSGVDAHQRRVVHECHETLWAVGK